MSLSVVIGNQTICVIGGLSSSICTLDEIQQISNAYKCKLQGYWFDKCTNLYFL